MNQKQIDDFEALGGEIESQVNVSIARSDDYLRAFHHLRYDVRQPVKWQRLAFCQLGADYYNDTPARRVLCVTPTQRIGFDGRKMAKATRDAAQAT